MDQGSNKNHSPAYNFAPTVTKFCVVWEGLSFPHDTKFGNCRCEIVDSRAFPSWSLIHGLPWSGLIKAEPELSTTTLKVMMAVLQVCRSEQDGHLFADNIFKCILFNENYCILNQNFIEACWSFDDKSGLVQAMTWHKWWVITWNNVDQNAWQHFSFWVSREMMYIPHGFTDSH